MPDTLSTAEVADGEQPSPSVRVAEPRAHWANVGIFIILFFGAIYFAASFVLPVVFALLFMLVLSPVVRVAKRRLRMPEPLTAGAVVLTTTLALIAGFYTLSGPLMSVAGNAPRYIEAVNAEVAEIRGWLVPARPGPGEVSDALERVGAGGEAANRVVLDGPNLLGSAAMMVPQVGASLGFALLFLFFLLSSRSLFYQKLIEVIPSFSNKKKALLIAYEIETELSRYLFTITLINLGLGVAIGVAMWVVGLPTPYVFGALAFLLNFIPYLGAIAGVLLVGLVGLAETGAFGDAVVPMLVYLAVTSVEGQLVTPILVGRRLQMNAAAVFLAVAFWGWIWGVVGMFLAVPIMVGVKILSSYVGGLHAFGNFLSSERHPVPEDGAGKDAPATRA